MAVKLTVAELSAALKLGDSPEELEQVTRLLAYVSEAIERHCPECPEATASMAAIVLGAYLWDRPTSSKGISYSNALKFSGAVSILLPWRVHRIGVA